MMRIKYIELQYKILFNCLLMLFALTGKVFSQTDDGVPIPFKTEMPTTKLTSPINDVHVAPFGVPIELKWESTKGAESYEVMLYWKDQYLLVGQNIKTTSLTLSSLPYVMEGVKYMWTVTPIGPTGQFVPVAEKGAPSKEGSFVTDKSLLVKPV